MATLPAKNILDGSAVPLTSAMKTAMGQLRDFLAGLLGSDGTAATARTALGLDSGFYTPTAGGTHTNVAAVNFFGCQYMKVGNVVTVSGVVQVQTTAAGGAQTVLKMSIPVASAFTGSGFAGGAGTSAFGGGRDPLHVRAVASASHVELVWDSSSTTLANRFFTFTYSVI